MDFVGFCGCLWTFIGMVWAKEGCGGQQKREKQIMKTDLGPKRRIWHRLGPFSVFMGLRWLLWAFVGFRWHRPG